MKAAKVVEAPESLAGLGEAVKAIGATVGDVQREFVRCWASQVNAGRTLKGETVKRIVSDLGTRMGEVSAWVKRADALEEEVKSIIAEPLPTKIVLEGGGRWIDSDLTDAGFANSVRAAVRNDDPIARMSAYAKLAFKIEDAVEGFERKVEKLKERECLAPGGTPESIVVHRKLEQIKATVRVLRLRFGKVIDRFYDLRRQNLRQILGASVALSDRYPHGNTAMRLSACRFPIENTLKLMIEQEMKTLKSKGVN